jgi:phosphopantetheine--protein transferase-like protein
MPEIEKLQEIIAEFMKVPVDTVGASTALTGVLAGSLGRARLDAILRSRMGISNPGVYTIKTFGELCQLAGADISGVSPAAPEPQRNKLPKTLTGAFGRGVAIGIDMQSLDAMPEATDYWENEFYVQHYTRQEIAYALLQPNPRESLAAMWCAKEALRKADGRWLEVDWHRTEVAHTPTGEPMLMSGGETLPYSLSLSHTCGLAIAVVAMMAVPSHSPQPVASSFVPTVAMQPGAMLAHRTFAAALSVVAILFSLIAIAVALLKR